ncbi:hypothetical protein [Adlercreutzia sp. ZJ242]|uniref:hypothetical protein n=1 Tax=Adlercreutzia sp. ZJ242 TaxID=2709409 RepID=UPI0013ECF7A5|nr:hypothetical protein [Adlercreutzia sp. ZJ242]
MSPALSEKIIASDQIQTGSVESIEVLEELERRRDLVQEGRSKLVPEDESWEFLRRSGCHV